MGVRTGTVAAAGGSGRLAGLHPAVRVGAAPLILATALLLPAAALPAWLLLLAAALRAAGVRAGDLAAALRPWAPIVALILAVHALTTVEAAPLGRPSVAGLLRGLTATGRLAALAAAVSLLARATPLPDLVAGLAWWDPRRRTDAAARLGVTLAVAAGTGGRAVAEGRRLDAVVRLRRGGAAARGPLRRVRRRLLDAAHLVVPLVESLLRRGEALTLALQGRVPAPRRPGPPPRAQLAGLALWAAALVVLGLGAWR